MRFLEHADRIGALDHLLLFGEPFPEEIQTDISDLPVLFAADEIPLQDLLEVEMSAIAAQLSRERLQPVRLQEIPEDYQPYDGAAFAKKYKLLKYPSICSQG